LHSIIKTASTNNRERILKAVSEKKKKKRIKLNPSKTGDFSAETLKARGYGVRYFQH
jgi:hypothetical protein